MMTIVLLDASGVILDRARGGGHQGRLRPVFDGAMGARRTIDGLATRSIACAVPTRTRRERGKRVGTALHCSLGETCIGPAPLPTLRSRLILRRREHAVDLRHDRGAF